ncbi:MAG TPA: TolC family protein [Longimicrobiales bacterium]
MRPLRCSGSFRSLAILVLGLAAPGAAAAQQAPATLTLEEAIALARRNNPEFLIQQNDEAEADWAVREAYGALLPSASIGGSLSYDAAGEQRLGVFSSRDLGFGTTPAYLSSSYSIGVGYRLSADALFRPGQEKANRNATQARIQAAAFDLAAEVTRRYLAAVAARDGVALASQELERATENLQLARARVAVGAAIALDAKQAEVERGRAEVELLRAENLLRTETLRLVETIGLELDREIELTSRFDVFEPNWSTEALVEMALARHPQLRAQRAQEKAAEAAVRMARSQYLPTLDLSMRWRGYAQEVADDDYLIERYRNDMEARYDQCMRNNDLVTRLNPPLPIEDCSRLVADPTVEAQLLEENNVFPFDFAHQPFTATLSVSLPVFNGFTRERRVEAARVAAEDARLRVRAEELRLKTEVASAHATLQAAYRAVTLESRNRELAGEQLELARERYRVGAITFVDLTDAETRKSRADRAYLNAVYAFHEALAALETAVGQNLRPRPGEE